MKGTCLVCSSSFEVTTLRRKTCSTTCAAEHKRRKRRAKEKRSRNRLYQNDPAYRERVTERNRKWRKSHYYYYYDSQLYLATRKLFCRGCGADISHLKWARYCGEACRPRQRSAYQPRPRFCHECGTAISRHQYYCEGCKTAPHIQRRNKQRGREYATERRIKTNAAVQIYRLLNGETTTTKRERYRTKCLVCGIEVTRPHNKICSDTCRRSRELERREAYRRGESLPRPVLPPLHQRQKAREARRLERLRRLDPEAYNQAKEKMNEAARRRTQNAKPVKHRSDNKRSAIYQAFRELKLLPQKEEQS